MDARRPARLLWLAILGYSLSRLIIDGFLAESAVLGRHAHQPDQCARCGVGGRGDTGW